MSLFLYNVFVRLYTFAIRVASLWNPKAKHWVSGRKVFPAIPEPGAQVVWMHCASLGEFEQGRPVLEQLRAAYPRYVIVLTFFSPSGYRACKDYAGADHIFYLPPDTRANAQRFIRAIQPSLVLWVKYEYWYHYLTALHRQGIPVLLVSGIFRKDQPFFKGYGGLWRDVLSCFSHLFVQTPDAAALLKTLGVEETVTVSGDTRFDRVLQIAQQFTDIDPVKVFCGNHPVIVAGSTWEEDEAELVHYVKLHPELRFIIAPHEIDSANLHDVKKTFAGSVFYSDWLLNPDTAARVLIIDNIGMLSRLYHYAAVTYVGGGFGSDGVHNVLEAAVYGKPVVFGPEYEKYVEAVELVEAGGAFSIEHALELEALLDRLLSDGEALQKAGKAAGEFVATHSGAAASVLRYIQEKRLLIS